MALALCQSLPYLQTFKTKVLSCAPVAENDKGSKRQKEEKKQQLWDVQLEDTILFPEGGGQPSDVGHIDDAEVTFVHRLEGKAIHKCTQALTVGQEVTVKVNWDKRYDHMQQHSSQHLISAIFVQLYGFKTVSWWMATYPTESHIELGTNDVTSEQLAAVEKRVNEVISGGAPMKVHTYDSLEQALADPNFAEKAKKIPKVDGAVRVIEIPNVDFNTCCGTHLQSTSEMQLVHLSKVEKGKGSCKVYFLAGDRCLVNLRQNLQLQRQLTSTLSTSPDQCIDALKKIQNDMRAMNKTNAKLMTELATLTAQQLIHEANSSKVVSFHRDESNMSFISTIADVFSEVRPHNLLLVSCTEVAGSKEGQFLLVGPEDLVNRFGADFAKSVEGRGGGRKGRYQGKANSIDQRDTGIVAIKTALMST